MGIRSILITAGTMFGIGAAVAGGTGHLPMTATAATTTATAVTTPAPAATEPRCDDGRWQGPGSIDPNGRPQGFHPGAAGGVYLWHDDSGWHLRTTDSSNTPHHYSGTIALSRNAHFTGYRTVRLDNGDRVWVDGGNVLHYEFTTYAGIDGIDFHVSGCDVNDRHETLAFHLVYDGRDDVTSRIRIGAEEAHPAAASFTIRRTV